MIEFVVGTDGMGDIATTAVEPRSEWPNIVGETSIPQTFLINVILTKQVYLSFSRRWQENTYMYYVGNGISQHIYLVWQNKRTLDNLDNGYRRVRGIINSVI